MNIDIVGWETLPDLRDVVVVIDVLRAFTTAAYAFGGGAKAIALVATVDEAVALRARFPAALLVGEVGGYPIDGFDCGNSPFELTRRALGGAMVIQRTSSGTRAAVAAKGARVLVAASFACAEATVRYILRCQPAHVALVVSGRRGASGGGDDLACASYLAARLLGEAVASEPFLARVRDSDEARRFRDGDRIAFPAEDLDLALELDRFDFAMVARREGDLLLLEPTASPPQGG